MSSYFSAVKVCSHKFNSPRALVCFSILVPLFFGLVSVLLGQDSNWDLFNYHWYNAFSWLNGKHHIDLAPAGLQSYFNPLLDLPYYVLNQHLPAPWVGFVMGWLHGLNFLLLLGIARKALPDLPAEDSYRVPLLLAAAGCLTANFLSVLGNSMGDNTTALFELATLLILLSHWQRLCIGSWHGMLVAWAAGLIAGLGAGLKLTNIIYAVAFCPALLIIPIPLLARIRLVLLFGMGTLIGVFVAGGFWFYEMWRTFGNPLFPQFSSFFPNSLTQNIAVADTIWLPKGLFETLFWPFIFAFDSHRVGQLSIRQIIWPILYLAFGVWSALKLCKRLQPSNLPKLDRRAAYVLIFVALGYLVWMKLFSIYRYIVPIEMLAPLALWILMSQMMGYIRARRLAAWIISLCTVVVLAGGTRTWGHEPWAASAFRATTPVLADPSSATVLTMDYPYAWLIPFFPESVAFVGLSSSFPEAPAYVSRAQEIVKKRNGAVYALIKGHHNWRLDNVARANELVSRLGFTRSQRGCEILGGMIKRLHLHASVQEPITRVSGAQCSLGLLPSDKQDSEAENHLSVAKAATTLERYGFVMDSASCTLQQAFAGQAERPYQLCRVRLK